MKIEFLQELLITGMALSTITVAMMQKIKAFIPSSKYIVAVSLIVNLLVGSFFCMTFTNIDYPISIWVGLFSFLGADIIFKSLNGVLKKHQDIINKDAVVIKKENIINEEEI